MKKRIIIICEFETDTKLSFEELKGGINDTLKYSFQDNIKIGEDVIIKDLNEPENKLYYYPID